MVAIAIGVGKARPLPFLRGAINGAVSFAAWSTAMGHEAHLITDQDQPVTLERLRDELERVLGGPPIYRLLLYFAGHGLIRELEEGLWLLSDWYQTLRAVAVEPLKRRLYWYGIAQIAIFADACRKLPPDVTAADLAADPVLGRGPQKMKAPAIDKFIAAQDGMATFMIPGATPSEDRCLFSGVLLEGLWGIKQQAFSRRDTGRITSRSLAKYLEDEVAARSEAYGKPVVPTVLPTFPEEDDIYYGEENAPRPTPPVFPAWPPAGAQRSPLPPVTQELPGGADWIRGLESTAGGEPGGVDVAKGGLESLGEGRSPAPPIRAGDGGLEPGLLDRVREQSRPASFETGAGFVVDGVRGAWSLPELTLEQHGEPTWWRVRHRADFTVREPAPVVLELADDRFIALTCLPDFIAGITLERDGASAVIYREIHAPPQTAYSTEAAIAAMEARAGARETTVALAVELRQGKHADPVRGVLSGYLYDGIGDVDSIRRMACYYVMHGQAIPYDIALLGQLEARHDGARLVADVPKVEKRKPREAEQAFPWAYSETPAASGVVGGRWPWLRQGWAYLDDPIDAGSALIDPALIEIRRHLRSARFTTLDAVGASKLRAWLGLVPALGGT